MKKILLLLCFILTFASHAGESCIPENNRYIPTGLKSMAVVTEDAFHRAIDGVEEIYKPYFKEHFGAELKVFRKWEDGTVNAYAKQSGKVWEVHMFGGLARHEETTEDGFTAVVCHELGHHVAGAPKKSSWWGASWASNEGQSDYFATTKCLRKLFEIEEEKTLKIYQVARTKEEKLAKKACQDAHSSELDSAVCYRSSLAGKSLARLLGSLGGNANVKFDTPDKRAVSKTNHNHPQAQCRLDTYFQGALCDKSHDIMPDMVKAEVGFCVRNEGYEVGARPKCWYSPSEYGTN